MGVAPTCMITIMPTNSQDNRPFAARIRAERLRLGLSQAEFGAAGGVSKTTQVAYESGTHIPDLTYLVGITELGADATFVWTGKQASTYGGTVLNWDLLEELIEAVDRLASERSSPLPMNLKFTAIRLLYSHFSSDGVIDWNIVRDTLRLAA
jgi:transcriptional regulator with XRE-family HTH domain